MKTKWDLTQLYTSAQDPQIEADLLELDRRYRAFAEKYRDRDDYLRSEPALAAALADYNDLEKDFAGAKPIMYFHYRKDLNSGDREAEAALNRLSERYSQIGNQIIFFTLKLAKIAPAEQEKFLANAQLRTYHYFLKKIFAHARHTLSEEVEKVLNLKSLPARELWVRATEKKLGEETIKWQGKILTLSQAGSLARDLKTPARRRLGKLLNQSFQQADEMAEGELNAIVLDKKINDNLRGYQEPYSATVLGYENDKATVDNLVKTVTDHFPLAHRFYRLKAKLLGEKKLAYIDRNASVGRTKRTFSFEQATELVSQALAKINPEYATTFREFLERGQIDVFPKVGKTGGAYCSSGENLPTFVLLNYVPSFEAVTTLAHEMGHALHSRFSQRAQPPIYRDYSTAAAEVASTFFENFIFDEVFPLLSPSEQIVALHDKLNDSITTIFRQIACFNFELALHREIRTKGNLSKVEIAKLMNKHMAAYLGPAFKLTTEDGYFFSYWSHLRRFFYVYSYAFGELVSSALYARYRANPAFETQIRQFLSAGSSASPEDIFAAIGVNVREPKFFEAGLKKIEADIVKLEKLVIMKKK